VAIESILLKDINFSVELQQSLSSAATQKRIGESKVIAARAEVDAAKLMRQAADVSRLIQKLRVGNKLIYRSLLLPLLCKSDSSRLCRTWQGPLDPRLSSVSPPSTILTQRLCPVPMNLAGMGAAGMDGNTAAQQMASSGDHPSGNSPSDQARINAQAGPGPATNAGLISQMANI
jgi:erythrocyte band 7 integral membrane protein